jgi:hypothetical protein
MIKELMLKEEKSKIKFILLFGILKKEPRESSCGIKVNYNGKYCKSSWNRLDDYGNLTCTRALDEC